MTRVQVSGPHVPADCVGDVVASFNPGNRPVPTAYVLCEEPAADTVRYRLFFCAERSNGRFEWLPFCERTRQFDNRADAVAYAQTHNPG